MEAVCIILGGGGHARVLIDCLQAAGRAQLYGVLDRDGAQWGQTLLGVPTLGGDELLADVVAKGVNCFAVGLGGIGDNRPRQRLFELGLSFGLEPLTVAHPTATCSRWAKIGLGSQLFPGSIVNAGAELGVNVIVNSGAIVEHDCIIGAHAHVATGARLASTVQVGEGAHIGAGATVRQCIAIGAGAIVGAGAVVVKDVPPYTVAVGVPARLLRQVEKSSPPREVTE
jgi:sugar O-acyltransferase (sialic acid O-acetyltransferase NeuD family)